MGDTISICAGCDPDAAARMAQEVRGLLGPATDVALAGCMNVCARPVSVAFRAPGKAAWLFAGVDPATQGPEVAAFARLYAADAGGDVSDARPCGQLRFCLIGRIPA